MSEDVRKGASDKSGEDNALFPALSVDVLKGKEKQGWAKCLKGTIFQTWQMIMKHKRCRSK